MTEHEAAPSRLDSFSQARELASQLKDRNRRANPDDPEYAQALLREREALKTIPTPDQIFGQTIIADIDDHRAESRAIGKPEAIIAREISPGLERSRADLERLLANHPSEAQRFLSELSEFKISDHAVETALEGLSHLTAEQYEVFLRSHIEKTRAILESKKPEITRMRDSFMARLADVISIGKIPLALDRAMQRLTKIEPSFADPWVMQLTDSDGKIMGTHDYVEGSLVLDPFLPEKELQETLDHELFHALQGITGKVEREAKEIGQDLLLRSGVAIRSSPQGEKLKREERFNWLNEAITERLAMELRDDKTSSYEAEDTLLSQIEKRVPIAIFYAAYFEDFTPEQGTPAWGELQRQLNEQFEPRILLTLDNIIASADDEETGLEDATKYLASNIKYSVNPRHNYR